VHQDNYRLLPSLSARRRSAAPRCTAAASPEDSEDRGGSPSSTTARCLWGPTSAVSIHSDVLSHLSLLCHLNSYYSLIAMKPSPFDRLALRGLSPRSFPRHWWIIMFSLSLHVLIISVCNESGKQLRKHSSHRQATRHRHSDMFWSSPPGEPNLFE